MGLDIYGGEAQQHVEWHHAPEEPLVAQSPDEEHQDGRYPHMAAGEGCRGALTCRMGILHHVIEETVAPAWHRQRFLMVGEVMPYIGEYASGDILQSCGLVVVLWSCDGQDDKDDVIDEERREDDEHRTVELLVAEEKGEQCHEGNHREIGGVAQVHQFTEHGVGEGLREQQGRLATAEPLIVRGEVMVEAGEDPVEFVCIWIPP